MMTFLTLLGACCSLGLLYSAFLILLRDGEIRSLDDFPADLPEPGQLISVVIAGRNEAETIEAAMRRLLADEDENRELIFVEDRSTDETRRIAETLAADYDSFTVVPIDELPAGWLGKVNALHQGSRQARGEWLLFSDADVHIDAGLLRHSVRVAEHLGLDHVAVLPRLTSRSFLCRVAIATFCGGLAAFSSRRRRQDPEATDHAIGVGAFNLCRRSVFERSLGFEWLRMEVADDMALALAMKLAGARHEVMITRKGLSVEWYPTLWSMVKGLEKNSFGAIGRYSRLRGLLLGLAFVFLPWGPLLVWHVSPMACLLPYLASASAGWLGSRRLGWDSTPFLFGPVGSSILGFIMLNSTWQTWRRGGIVWRGTHYSLDELRELQRIRA